MTSAVIGLIASYVVLAVLLLSLNLRSAWRWPVKALAIGVTTGFFVVAFLTLQAMLGWPTETLPPARFQLHAALIEEPDRKGRHPGAIYLWLSPRGPEGEVAGPPRAYALPYSRTLHEATARAQADLQAGRLVDGETASQIRSGSLATPSVGVDLFAPEPPPLPPKSS